MPEGYADSRPGYHRSLVVNTTSGRVRGTYLTSTVKAFLGIPYAQPPIRELRFKPPQEIETPGDTIIDATRYGNVCLQARSRSLFPLLANEGEEDEDCLNLNIFVPQQYAANASQQGLLPVMIWIYGGGFFEGFASGNRV